MSKKYGRRDFLKSGFLIASGSVVAVLSQILGCTDLPLEVTEITEVTKKTQVGSTEIGAGDPTTATEDVAGEELVSVDPSATPDTVPQSEPIVDPTATPVEQEPQAPQPQTDITSAVPAGDEGAKFPGRVVQIFSNNVHTWDYSDQSYWEYVDQEVVDSMVDQGLMTLTGENTIENAWRALIPNYQQSEVVAIKVSFNNSHDDAGSVNSIDAIVEPVNAIIRGLTMIGVPESSIVVYDSSRWIPLRFINGCDYGGVVYRHKDHDPWGTGSEAVEFTPPGFSTFTQQLSKEVAFANYLINVPVLKAHGMTKFSMGLKNHYGSIQIPSDLHQWSTLSSPDFSEDYNPMVDINNHEQIRTKTILILGDSIFAAIGNSIGSLPQRWVSFCSETPKSLFFATDPVAIDCVMADTLNQEALARNVGELNPLSFAHLAQAEEVGLGVYERGNPWKNSYSKIEFIRK
jgi:hypothetical protein